MTTKFSSEKDFEEYIQFFEKLKSQKMSLEHIQEELWEDVIGIGFFSDKISRLHEPLRHTRYRTQQLQYIISPLNIELVGETYDLITLHRKKCNFIFGKEYARIEKEYRIHSVNARGGFMNLGKVKEVKQDISNSEIDISVHENPRLEIEPIDITQEVYPLFQKDYEKIKTTIKNDNENT